MATYCDDAVVSSANAQLTGKNAMREFYELRLTDTSLRCELRSVLALGDRWVIAHEFVSSSGDETEVVAVFDVRNGLIIRASLTRD